MKPTRKPLTDPTRRTLGAVAQFGAERRWYRDDGAAWSWHVAERTDQGISRNVMTLYSSGYLEPDNGDRDRLKISAEGLRALGVAPLTQKRAA